VADFRVVEFGDLDAADFHHVAVGGIANKRDAFAGGGTRQGVDAGAFGLAVEQQMETRRLAVHADFHFELLVRAELGGSVGEDDGGVAVALAGLALEFETRAAELQVIAVRRLAARVERVGEVDLEIRVSLPVQIEPEDEARGRIKGAGGVCGAVRHQRVVFKPPIPNTIAVAEPFFQVARSGIDQFAFVNAELDRLDHRARQGQAADAGRVDR